MINITKEPVLHQPLPTFDRYIGIHYSGAETRESYLHPLRIYAADAGDPPREVHPSHGKQNWTRQTLAEWLTQALVGDVPTAVGIDHALSFPLAWFEKYRLPPDWRFFLDDFCRHWPTGEAYTYVESILEGARGDIWARHGHPSWLRLTEQRLPHRPSLFQFDRPRSIAKATHAGLPWLRLLAQQMKSRLHLWPIDGWACPPGKSFLAEVYPPLYAARWPRAERSPHQHAAYATAAWLQATNRTAEWATVTRPNLNAETERIARLEGWTLGVL
jgi:hypothetical protein